VAAKDTEAKADIAIIRMIILKGCRKTASLKLEWHDRNNPTTNAINGKRFKAFGRGPGNPFSRKGFPGFF
jgi:hypothetical protein